MQEKKADNPQDCDLLDPGENDTASLVPFSKQREKCGFDYSYLMEDNK